MKPIAPLLIVAADHREVSALRRLIDAPLTIDAFPETASLELESSLLGGMLIGASVHARLALPLVRAYILHQPCGRIAIISRDGDLSTLTAYAYRDGRVDVFFIPWRVDAVREHLGIETPSAV